jgi:hypothetical protein
MCDHATRISTLREQNPVWTRRATRVREWNIPRAREDGKLVKLFAWAQEQWCLEVLEVPKPLRVLAGDRTIRPSVRVSGATEEGIPTLAHCVEVVDVVAELHAVAVEVGALPVLARLASAEFESISVVRVAGHGQLVCFLVIFREDVNG